MRVIALDPSERRRAGRAGGLDLVLDHDLLRRVRFGLGLLVEMPAHLLDVERAFPARDDDSGDAVADQVGERARLRHEAVDAEDERDAGDRDGADRGQASRPAR